MDNKQVSDQYIELARLVVKGDKLINRLSEVSKKENRKHKTLDKLAFSKGLKNQTDKIIKKTSDLSLARAQNAYNNYIDQAEEYIDLDKIINEYPSYELKFKNEGILQHFANDFNIRMAGLDIDRIIRNLKRVRNSLYLQLKRLERKEEQIQIDEEFEKIIKQIEEI